MFPDLKEELDVVDANDGNPLNELADRLLDIPKLGLSCCASAGENETCDELVGTLEVTGWIVTTCSAGVVDPLPGS